MSLPIIDLKKVSRAINAAIDSIGGKQFDEKMCLCEDEISECDYCLVHNALMLSQHAINQNYTFVSGNMHSC